MTVKEETIGACGCGLRVGCAVHGPQPREHAVKCQRCRRATWAVDAVCDRCHQAEVERGGDER